VIAAGLTTAAPASAHDGITIASWGGAYARSQMLAHVKPFRRETGKPVFMVDFNGGLEQVRNQVESANVTWDVVSLQLSDAVAGCEAGLLEKIDPASLPAAPDGTAAPDDFLPGTLQDCAVGDILWSTVVAYDSERFKDDPPKTIADFFDLKKYPGPRGLRKTPQVNLEWALLAAGVAPDQVYPTLSTEEGVARAFQILDLVKLQAVWWEAGSEPVRLLADGKVAMTSAYNGRLYDAVARKGQRNIATLWDGQVRDINLWAIPKGSDRLEDALAFVRFATDTQHLADQARYISYGPTRKSSMAIINEEVKPFLPTAPENENNMLPFDSRWWAEHQEDIDRRFAAWLAASKVTPIVGFE
jgi:putative spermidine/putrescine transport system substrate-binding protein